MKHVNDNKMSKKNEEVRVNYVYKKTDDIGEGDSKSLKRIE